MTDASHWLNPTRSQRERNTTAITPESAFWGPEKAGKCRKGNWKAVKGHPVTSTLSYSSFSDQPFLSPNFINLSTSKGKGMDDKIKRLRNLCRASKKNFQNAVEIGRKNKGFLILIICGLLLPMLSLPASSWGHWDLIAFSNCGSPTYQIHIKGAFVRHYMLSFLINFSFIFTFDLMESNESLLLSFP